PALIASRPLAIVSHLPTDTRDLLSFPYTTLFRSVGWQQAREPRTRRVGIERTAGGIDAPQQRRDVVGPRGRGKRGVGAGATPDPDRKSTRLNSSHVKISYAVFCLKKKKDTQTKMS